MALFERPFNGRDEIFYVLKSNQDEMKTNRRKMKKWKVINRVLGNRYILPFLFSFFIEAITNN